MTMTATTWKVIDSVMVVRSSKWKVDGDKTGLEAADIFTMMFFMKYWLLFKITIGI